VMVPCRVGCFKFVDIGTRIPQRLYLKNLKLPCSSLEPDVSERLIHLFLYDDRDIAMVPWKTQDELPRLDPRLDNVDDANVS
jgi:hypothetical protein